MDPDQTAPSSLIWVHTVCLYAKCKFEKLAKRCSRRHKQTTFSDANFLGALRVKIVGRGESLKCFFPLLSAFSPLLGGCKDKSGPGLGDALLLSTHEIFLWRNKPRSF